MPRRRRKRFDRLGLGLARARWRRLYGDAVRGGDDEAAGRGFGGAQKGQDGTPEEAGNGPSRPAFGVQLRMRAGLGLKRHRA